MAVLLAQLPGSLNLRLVLSDLKFADILHDLVTVKGNRSGVPRALAVDRNETRELAGTLHIEGTNKDDAIAQIRAINLLVTGGTTLTLRSTGATGAVTLKVLPSRGVSQPLDELFELDGGPVLASCSFSFTCEPYAYGLETTVFNGSVTVPGAVDFTVPGDYKTPLNISWTPSGDYAGVIERFAMGLLPDQTCNFGTLFRFAYWGPVTIAAGNPAVCTYSGQYELFTGQVIRMLGTSTTPATHGVDYVVTVTGPNTFTIPVNITSGGSGQYSPWFGQDVPGVGTAHRETYGDLYMSQPTDAWAWSQIPDTGVPKGTYLPFWRLGKTTSGATPYVYISTTGALDESGFIWAGTGYELRVWAQSVAAPARRVIAGATSFFTIGMRAGPAGGAAQFDWFALLPVTWGFVHNSISRAAGNFTLGYDGIPYVASSHAGGIISGGMSAVGAQRMLFLTSPAGGWASAFVTGILTIKAIPRYTLWA